MYKATVVYLVKHPDVEDWPTLQYETSAKTMDEVLKNISIYEAGLKAAGYTIVGRQFTSKYIA